MSMLDSLSRSIMQPPSEPSSSLPAPPRTTTRSSRPPAIGKRAHRRRENALVVPNNPHAARPTRADLAPPAYGDSSGRPSLFSAVEASARVAAPSPAPPTSDPSSSSAGRYALSLRGVRQAMRRRGGRALEVVQRVEAELRPWAGPTRAQEHGTARIIDGTRVDRRDVGSAERFEEEVAGEAPGVFSVGTHPSAEHDRAAKSLVYSLAGPDKTFQSLVELAREPGRLVWHVPDPFDRLVVHLVARYYGLVSFSRTLGDEVRVTYVVLPATSGDEAAAATRAATTTGGGLMTPDASSATEVVSGSEAESEPDVEVERLVVSRPPPVTFRDEDVPWTPAAIDVDADSTFGDLSDDGSEFDDGASSLFGGGGGGTGQQAFTSAFDLPIEGAARGDVRQGASRRLMVEGEQRPTFFEYLYG